MCSATERNLRPALKVWNEWLDQRDQAPGEVLVDLVNTKMQESLSSAREALGTAGLDFRLPGRAALLAPPRECLELSGTEESVQRGDDEPNGDVPSALSAYMFDAFTLARSLASAGLDIAQRAALPHLEGYQEAMLLEQLLGGNTAWKEDARSQELLVYFANCCRHEASFTSDLAARDIYLARAQLYSEALDGLSEPPEVPDERLKAEFEASDDDSDDDFVPARLSEDASSPRPSLPRSRNVAVGYNTGSMREAMVMPTN